MFRTRANGDVSVTALRTREKLPAWVEAFNAEGRAQAAFGQGWERLREPAIYDAVQGPDDAPGENTDFGFGRTFPKQLTGGAAKITPAFYTAFDNSPFCTELLGVDDIAPTLAAQLGVAAPAGAQGRRLFLASFNPPEFGRSSERMSLNK